MSNTVLVRRDGAVLAVTLNRPDRKNALDLATYRALTAALDEAAAAPEVRVVLLRAEGDVFCGGNDVVDFVQSPPTGEDSPVLGFLFALLRFPKPVVAAVQGPAVGIGTTMLLHCDLVHASTAAVFSMPFAQLGLVPEAASSLLVPRLVGQRVATELLVLGERFDAARAERLGFVNRVVAPEELDASARAAAERLAALPPAAVRASKALLRGHDRAEVEAAVRTEAAVFLERLRSPEAAEAFSAFLEKRAPDFSRFS